MPSVVSAGGGQTLAIWRECHRADIATMACQRQKFLAIGSIPESSSAIPTSCRDDLPVRRIGKRQYSTFVTDQALHLYPPPFSREGKDVSAVSRRAVPVHEVWGVAQDFRAQLGIG